MSILVFAILGLGTGAVYALLSVGVVLIYRGSGVVNFAQGAVGMAAAALFYQLRDLSGWNVASALALSLISGGLLGAGIYVLLMRRLAHASALARLICTLGVLALLEAVVEQRVGNEPVGVPSFLPIREVRLAPGIAVGQTQLVLFGIATLLTILLAVVYRRTKFGLATSAVAENPRAAASLGWSPHLIATVNWVVGCLLAALAMDLILNLTGALDPVGMTELIVPALAAALVGGFSSFGFTYLGAMGIGILQSEIIRVTTTPGAVDVVPFLLIVAVLIVRGKSLPTRGHDQDRAARLGSGRVRWGWLVFWILAALLLILLGSVNWVDAITSTLIGAILIFSVVVVTGYAGQVSLAQYGIAGMGALAATRAAVHWGLSFEVALLIGVAFAIPLGVVVGLPALRLRGVNLAVATLGLGLVLQDMVLLNPSHTGGLAGTTIGPPRLFGIDVSGTTYPVRFALVALVLAVGTGLMVASLRRGRAGHRLIAVRTNERAAASLGINVTVAKLWAFAIASGLAGLAGALMGLQYPNVDFTIYSVFNSIIIILYAVLGGIGFVTGAVFGGTVVPGALDAQFFYQFIHFGTYVVIIVGSLLTLFYLTHDPDGLVDLNLTTYHRLRARQHWRRFSWGRLVPQRLAVRRAEEIAPEDLPNAVSIDPHKLIVEGLTVNYGKVVGVDNVSFTVGPGEIVGLIGPNGAGKSSLIDAVTGFTPLRAGKILVDGTDVTSWSPHRRARFGIRRSFQSLELLDSLSAEANILLGCDNQDPRAYLTNLVRGRKARMTGTAIMAVEQLGLKDHLNELTNQLTLGQRRRLTIARAVASGPFVLLLDEPAAGINTDEIAELEDLLRKLAKEWGIGILLVEHNVGLVVSVCDRVIALDMGRVIAEGSPEVVRHHPDVVEAYLGVREPDKMEEIEDLVDVKEKVRPSVLRLNGISAGYSGRPAIEHVNIDVAEGEIVALLGPNGAGKTTTLMVAAGELKPLSGTVVWLGQSGSAPLYRRVRAGLGYVPEDRSILMDLSVEANLRLSRRDIESALELFPELRTLLRRRVGLLSGGEQRILSLACALVMEPRLLLVDEISLGLAPIIVTRLFSALRQAARGGMAILLVEQQAHRALEIADRAYVLANGRLIMEDSAESLRGRFAELEAGYLSGVKLEA